MTASSAGFVFDVSSLEGMRRRARETPNAAAAEVATQFEALFLQMAMQRMREATPKDGLFDSEQTRMMQSMLDEQMATHLASPGIGIAKALLRQMQRQGGADAAPVAAFSPLAAPDRVHATGGASSAPLGAARRVLDAVRTGAEFAASGARAIASVPAHVAAFVDKLGDAARQVAQRSGLPARLILAQAALESGWGQREIRLPDGGTSHNLFGIKATGGWKGEVANVMTTEYVDGVPRKVRQPFRAYGSYEEALTDYARLLTESERYRGVREARNEFEAARRVQAAGYATDPAYADKLIGLMRQMPA
ncbi:flagellar assembly peptidoglycan hydrolase FlgJ [Verticiella sediminum]|uniref:Peptidoglycan hydrolase FlgJ n=1 Tax=Verticiella sediminum TaxID=1247510 RepID=A0A556ARU7_9BURK|nr:flagellar assembly peptidoglycan hydrolase FlgJ [Verticiella sediminum]TSH95674.1 flagellar assembly peptidoglycan hydrolase FlgJ [Verticiella sediminum]